MSKIDPRREKLKRMADSVFVLEKLKEVEDRVEELEKALEESGWVYFNKKGDEDASNRVRKEST